MALSGMFRRRARLSAALTCALVSFAARAGSGALPSSSRVSGASRSSKASSAAGEVLAQLVPQPLHGPGALPDERLVRAGQHLDALCLRAVPGRRAQLVRVSAHHVREHVRVAAVALRAGHAVPLPVPGRLQRVHREHRVAGGDQRGHPRAVIGLDPDDHLRLIRVLAQVPADQLVQLRDPGHALGQPPFRQHFPGLIHHFHVVMVLSPVIAHEQPHQVSSQQCRNMSAASRRTISDLMKLCSRHPAGTTSQQRSTLPVTGRGTICQQGSKPGRKQCSPAGGHHTPSLPYGRPANSY